MLDCADSLISVGPNCISGSERKRLSVACKVSKIMSLLSAQIGRYTLIDKGYISSPGLSQLNRKSKDFLTEQ